MPSDTSQVSIIAHRGASALRPEHTLAAYARAIEDGADAIEPDLVSTKDGFLVARHENEISGTTDIADHPEFASRKTRKSIDGEKTDGWFTEDFTLTELRTLRARERLPELRSTAYDDQFGIVTLDEIIELVASESPKHGRVIGIVPEIKHPTYFAGLGLAMEDKLLATLMAHSYTQRAPVTIQSFETGNLRYLRDKIGATHSNIELLQLLGETDGRPYDAVVSRQRTTYGDMMRPSGLREIATYADAIGASIKNVDLRSGAQEARSALVDDAHAEGLKVVIYTFRPENHFLGPEFKGGGGAAERNESGSVREMRRYIAAGIDAVFTDDPALGREAVVQASRTRDAHPPGE
ncbi:glycerophosphodiester phosphodiesterase [Pseudoxanthomonas sacheonensis]|uniref:glycerophosphodiester phosphodiesterase n=1 Tax=Pseudoxanthomonas sacheonensis TaxID=443615 RepID=A0ABU1RNB9_9GAMM|nr:glycerophosphodiester phosphodiesterase [Pseudoxanthomonas sacheonensis]MDR6840271.1 glycerophosphoryl diester phosphodiesterase [Pseudoxanthomonas sacheonensis]